MARSNDDGSYEWEDTRVCEVLGGLTTLADGSDSMNDDLFRG